MRKSVKVVNIQWVKFCHFCQFCQIVNSVNLVLTSRSVRFLFWIELLDASAYFTPTLRNFSLIHAFVYIVVHLTFWNQFCGILIFKIWSQIISIFNGNYLLHQRAATKFSLSLSYRNERRRNTKGESETLLREDEPSLEERRRSFSKQHPTDWGSCFGEWPFRAVVCREYNNNASSRPFLTPIWDA